MFENYEHTGGLSFLASGLDYETKRYFFFQSIVLHENMVHMLKHLLFWLQVAGLILENTFTSVLDMAGVMLPGLRYIVGGKGGLLNWFVKSPWKTIELIKHVSSPILSIPLAVFLFGSQLFTVNVGYKEFVKRKYIV